MTCWRCNHVGYIVQLNLDLHYSCNLDRIFIYIFKILKLVLSSNRIDLIAAVKIIVKPWSGSLQIDYPKRTNLNIVYSIFIMYVVVYIISMTQFPEIDVKIGFGITSAGGYKISSNFKIIINIWLSVYTMPQGYAIQFKIPEIILWLFILEYIFDKPN